MEYTSGKKLTNVELSIILNNFSFSNHVIERLNERRKNLVVKREDGSIDLLTTKTNVIKDIKSKVILAYYNTDGSINVAIDKYNYYVFTPTFRYGKPTHFWKLVTFKEPSLNGIDIYENKN